YLERHAGKPRTVVKVVGTLPGSREEAWARLTGASGLGFDPIEGKTFTTQTGRGDSLHGRVVLAEAPGALGVTIDELGDAFLAHSMARAGGGSFVYSVLSLYGRSAAEVVAIRATWEPWLTAALGIESVAGVR